MSVFPSAPLPDADPPDAGIRYGVAHQVATIALDRPASRNAMDLPMRAAFARAVATALEDEDVRVIVLTGHGGHFCAGGDVRTMTPEAIADAPAGRRRMRQAQAAVERLARTDKPVIAAVDGVAYGGGFGLALLADLILATPSARFCLSFLQMGLVPDCGVMYTLPRLVGVQRAKALIFTGRVLDADTALAWGVVTELVPAAQLAARAQALAETLAQSSVTALALAKTGVDQSLSSTLPAMLEYEAAAQGVAFASEEHREAVRRFAARRAAAAAPGTAAPLQPETST